MRPLRLQHLQQPVQLDRLHPPACPNRPQEIEFEPGPELGLAPLLELELQPERSHPPGLVLGRQPELQLGPRPQIAHHLVVETVLGPVQPLAPQLGPLLGPVQPLAPQLELPPELGLVPVGSDLGEIVLVGFGPVDLGLEATDPVGLGL